MHATQVPMPFAAVVWLVFATGFATAFVPHCSIVKPLSARQGVVGLARCRSCNSNSVTRTLLSLGDLNDYDCDSSTSSTSVRDGRKAANITPEPGRIPWWNVLRGGSSALKVREGAHNCSLAEQHGGQVKYKARRGVSSETSTVFRLCRLLRSCSSVTTST